MNGWWALWLAGCCGGPGPSWNAPQPIYLDGQAQTLDLAAWVDASRQDLSFTALGDASVIAEINETSLTLTPQPGWSGDALVELTVADPCGNTDTVLVDVFSGSDPDGPTPGGPCATTLTFQGSEITEAVAVAGSFNGWSTDSHLLADRGDGTWTIDLDLAPGSYPYKLVETRGGAFGGDAQWLCDPEAAYAHCDAGYIQPWETDWSHQCEPGVSSCNSLLVVRECAPPRLEVTSLAIDRAANAVTVAVDATAGSGGALVSARATLDDVLLSGPWEEDPAGGFRIDQSGLSDGRHTLRFTVTDAAGNVSEEAYVPFWTDDRDWQTGLMYFAFLDRLNNGDPTNDGSEGASATWGGYEGGDLQGLIDMLPYLDDLGVTVLWISNAQDNAPDAWAGDCNLTYAGYHAYWPGSPYAVEEHFGTEATLEALVDAAHDRGMRVVMDWVANHVHEAHPYATDHPEWFNSYAFCRDFVDGQMNFDRIPETCWFAPYLPDIDYGHPDALTTMVDDAVWWATRYELDGFRADAVKHMSHAVNWNLASAIHERIQHTDAGGDEDFYTVGETFDGSYDRIEAYVGPNQLDGQFDFPLYFALRSTFISDANPVKAVVESKATSDARFSGLMSTFLGNHDVLRFTTDAAEGYQDICDNGQIRVAGAPQDSWPYDRMRLAWTFLFTNPGVPLIYYGDELGIPGHPDPDNRQPLWVHTGGNLDGVSSVADLAGRVSGLQASVLRHVQALALARADHPALSLGSGVEWWDDGWDLYAYTRSSGADHAIVVLNRSEQGHSMTNGLAFAGLPTSGTWRDVLTGDTFTAAGDTITIDVGPRSSRVLVLD